MPRGYTGDVPLRLAGRSGGRVGIGPGLEGLNFQEPTSKPEYGHKAETPEETGLDKRA